MSKPKLLALHLTPKHSWADYSNNNCEIEINGIKLEIMLTQEQVGQLTNAVYEKLGSIIMQYFAEKIHPELASDEKGFNENPLIKPLSLPNESTSIVSEEPAF